MVVLLAWAGAVLVAAVVFAAVTVGLLGHARRLRRAVADAHRDLRPRLAEVTRALPPRREPSSEASPT